MTISEEHWMRRALELALQGEGRVEPNPMVGCVIVRDDRVVGEGWHKEFGGPHAETHALRAAGPAARGASLYVTLEPCSHHGKTPPCADTVVEAGVRRVVAAVEDPDPRVSGAGMRRLRAGGVETISGLLRDDARKLLAPYWKRTTSGHPWVIGKWAMSLDGKIASATGDSQWITGEAARRRGHQLRGRVDAILVGVGTALADDCLLTARPPGPRAATRVVVDSRARLRPDSRLAKTSGEAPVLIACGPQAEPEAIERLRETGCEVFASSEPDANLRLVQLMRELAGRGATNVLVEGGGRLLGSLRDLNLLDELHVFMAPCLIGGRQAPTPVAGLGAENLADAWRLESTVVEQLDRDIYVHGRTGRWRP